MNTLRRNHLFLVILTAVLLAVGCNGSETPTADAPPTQPADTNPTPTTEPSVEVVTVVVSPTPEAIAQGETPTATPLPIDEPTPTATAMPSPSRITFEPGATAATVTGTVTAGGAVSYVLRAAAGQQLITNLKSDSGDVTVAVTDPNGSPVPNPTNAILSATGDYRFDIVGGAVDTNYSMTVGVLGETPPQPAPTATPTTAVPPTGQPTRINFAPGATSTTVSGSTNANSTAEYVLRAATGQTMTVNIASPNNDVLLTVVSPTGVPLKRYVDGSSFWTGTLPETGDYNLKAVAVGGATSYTLEVSVVTPSQPPQPEPIRISFAPGATSATVNGSVGMNSTISYVLRAGAGQTMTVTVTGPQDEIALRITGPTGLFKDDPTLTWTSVLPADGDYLIDIVSVLGAYDKSYSMTVSIVN